MSRPRHTLGISKLRRAQLVGGPYIELIATHEAMVQCLYQTFAIAYPSMAKFWNQLAAEEEQHYRLVQALKNDIENNDVSFQRPAFSQAQVRDSIAWVCARKERIQKGGVSINEALTMCIQIEQGMVEHKFFDVMSNDNEHVSGVLSQLEKSSTIHLNRARAEARRLKWKILGSKKNKPFSQDDIVAAPLDTKEDPMVTVKIAQAAILASLITLEEAAANLYNTYAELLPDSAKLWSALAADEMMHATMLHKLEDILDNGNLFRNMGQFGIRGVERTIDDLMNSETKARRHGVSYTEAMITALRVESYMVECEFYKTVESDAPEFKYIATRLVELTNNHIKKLEDGTSPMNSADTLSDKSK